MNTIWLKIAGVAVVALVVIIVVGSLTSKDDTSANPPQAPEQNRNFDDMAKRDQQFLQEPNLAAGTTPEQQAETTAPVGQQAQQPEATAQSQPVEPEPQPQAQPASPYVMPSSITKKTTLYFKPLDEIDDIAAQQLMPYATTGRSIGRLPVMQYGLMVTACRQAEDRWPDSWYAFRAKQLLEEIRERYSGTYKITEEELDISKFLKPRPGTQAREVEPVQQ